MAENDKSIKSFWSRPEGKLGMPLMIGLLGIGGFFLYKALPAIIALMQNTLTAIGLGLAIFAILSVLMNDRFRSTVWYLYKGLMRWFTGIVIELNPIAILESYVEDIEEKIVKMEEQLTGLKGQIGKINIKLTKNRDEWKMEMERAAQAKKMGKDAEVALHTRQAGRLEGYITNIDALYKKMEVLYKVLDKMKYYSEIMVKDTKMTVEIKKEEREAITASHSVMKSAMNIINGNEDKKVIFDQAMEFVVDDIGFKVGEMERMLEASTSFINSVDLDNAVYEERGVKMLEDFDKKGMDAIFGSKKEQTSLPAGTVYNTLNSFIPMTQNAPNNSDASGEKKKYF